MCIVAALEGPPAIYTLPPGFTTPPSGTTSKARRLAAVQKKRELDRTEPKNRVFGKLRTRDRGGITNYFFSPRQTHKQPEPRFKNDCVADGKG